MVELLFIVKGIKKKKELSGLSDQLVKGCLENYLEKYKINPAGEGGEFETLVLNCPMFKKRLELK